MFWSHSIFVKLLSWFFLNLLLLALIMGLLFQIQFYVPPDSFLRIKGEAETASLRHLIRHELRQAAPAAWNELLERYGEAFNARLYLFTPDGGKLAGAPVVLPPELQQSLRQWYRKWAEAGPRRLHARPGGQGRGQLRDSPEPEAPRRFFRLRTSNPTRYWLGLAVPIRDPESGSFGPAVLLAASDSLFSSNLYPNPRPWLLAALVVIVVSLLWWWPLVRHLTRPLKTMTRATEAIARGRFQVQTDAGRRGDEIGRLARSINRMALQLEGFIAGQKRFLSDVAHELCSPLARLQMGLGVLENQLGKKHRAALAEGGGGRNHLGTAR